MNYLKQTTAKKTENQLAMYVGRWQPMHNGHKWLFEQSLDQGKDVLICVRDMPASENNPYSATEVVEKIKETMSEYGERVKIIVIPDIESINIGRDVGYDIIEHVPPTEIAEISATKIRRSNGKP